MERVEAPDKIKIESRIKEAASRYIKLVTLKANKQVLDVLRKEIEHLIKKRAEIA